MVIIFQSFFYSIIKYKINAYILCLISSLEIKKSA